MAAGHNKVEKKKQTLFILRLPFYQSDLLRSYEEKYLKISFSIGETSIASHAEGGCFEGQAKRNMSGIHMK